MKYSQERPNGTEHYSLQCTDKMENRINDSPQYPDGTTQPDNKQPVGPKRVSSPRQQELAEYWESCHAETPESE